MTEAELKQFAELAKKFEAKDKDAVLKIVQDDLHPVFQAAHDQGHSAATKKSADELKVVTARAETAEKKVGELQKKVDAFDEKNPPDVKKLQQQHDQQLEQLQTTHKAELEKVRGETAEALVEAEVRSFVAELVSDHGVDKEYATVVLAKRQDIRDRFKPNAAGGVDVLQSGKTIPFVPTNEKTGSQLLAAEVASTVDAKWRKSKVGRGTSTKSGDGTGESSPTHFEGIRKSVQERKGQGAGQKRESALDRLGGSRR